MKVSRTAVQLVALCMYREKGRAARFLNFEVDKALFRTIFDGKCGPGSYPGLLTDLDVFVHFEASWTRGRNVNRNELCVNVPQHAKCVRPSPVARPSCSLFAARRISSAKIGLLNLFHPLFSQVLHPTSSNQTLNLISPKPPPPLLICSFSF